MKEKIICVRLNADMFNKVDELSKSYNISKSNLIRRILYSFLSQSDEASHANISEYSADSSSQISQSSETDEMKALASLSKEHYLLKKKVEEMERKQERIYELLTSLTSQLKIALQKQ